MKNKLFWISKYFSVGLLIFTMLFAIGCSGSGDKSDPFANNEYSDDSNHSNGSNLSGVLALIGGLFGNSDDTTTTAGSLDTTFGTGGKVTTSIGIVTTSGGSSYDHARSVAIQSDGKIVVVGDSDNQSHFAVVRYNADGSLDGSFGSGGKATTSIAMWDLAYGVAIQSDQKIVVVGSTAASSYSYCDIVVVRYNTDGSLDTSFGSGGIVITAIGSYHDEAYSVAIQSDQKIVVAGYSSDSSNTHAAFALVRYNTDGSLDTNFGSGGKVTTAIGSNDYAKGVAIQSDGKIVLAGQSYNGSDYDFALARYNANNGSLDTSFGSGGKVTTAIGTGHDLANGVAIQSNQKIVVAGFAFVSGSSYDFALARYNTDGSLDTTFDTDGKVTTAIGTGDDEAYSVAIQSDGAIVVVGYSYNGSDYDFALARYLQ